MEARIAPAKAPWPAPVQARFDVLPQLRLFRVLARDDRLFARFMDGGFLDKGHLTLRDRELAILTVCARRVPRSTRRDTCAITIPPQALVASASASEEDTNASLSNDRLPAGSASPARMMATSMFQVG